MNNLVRILAVLFAASLLGACGGGNVPAASDVAPPAVADNVWDAWNWDEAAWGE